MGDIIGGIIGGVGSIIGGNEAADAEREGAKQALTGFNYLTGSPIAGYVGQGGAANSAISQLLGTSAMTPGTSDAFNNYLKSTGYQFQLGQGTQALTGSAAAKGILNSGATAKALTNYGQGLASTTFNNYLNQLSGLSQQGLQAGLGIGAAGSAGGAAAGGLTAQAGQSQGTGLAQGLNYFGGALGGGTGSFGSSGAGQLLNFFGGL